MVVTSDKSCASGPIPPPVIWTVTCQVYVHVSLYLGLISLLELRLSTCSKIMEASLGIPEPLLIHHVDNSIMLLCAHVDIIYALPSVLFFFFSVADCFPSEELYLALV